MAMWEEYMEQRKQARTKEEEDLKKLKERQVSSIIAPVEKGSLFLFVLNLTYDV